MVKTHRLAGSAPPSRGRLAPFQGSCLRRRLRVSHFFKVPNNIFYRLVTSRSSSAFHDVCFFCFLGFVFIHLTGEEAG